MSEKILVEVHAKHESLVRRTLAVIEELEHLALTAPDGDVFALCEHAVLHKGRDLQKALLAEAVARRIDAAEKRGPRSALAPADARNTTAGPSSAT
jgi:hypothetical protein